MFYKPNQGHGLPHDPFKSLIVPRPIGWISSMDPDGRVNLAPYSFFNGLSSSPPIIVFGPGGQHSEGGLKDTISNIEATGEFVCNMATWELRDAMNASSAAAPRAVDEFALAGLTAAPSELVAPPRVAESPVHMECRHYKTIELPSDDPAYPNHAVLGEVIGIHIDDSVLANGLVDIAAIKPIARLGYMDYTAVESIFTMHRPNFP